MNQDQLRDKIAATLAKTNGFEAPGPFEFEQASRVWAAVVAPLLATLESARDNAITVGDRLGWRLVEAQQEVARLRREVEFEANGADTFAGADELHDEAVNRG